MTLNDYAMLALLMFGALLFLYDIKMMLFPQNRGRVLAVEDQLEAAKKACSCNSAKMGRSYVNATVRLEDGELTTVQVSPCLFCMDRVTIGSQIGVNRVGKRLIARLPIYPRYIRDMERWVDPALRPLLLRAIDTEGRPRTDEWVAGAVLPLPAADLAAMRKPAVWLSLIHI